MKATVLIPTHKRPEMLAQCLESVLAQTRLPDEIVIVDDNAGHPDFRARTRAVVDGFRINLPVQYLTPDKNIGLAAARNLGLGRITEGVVAFLDDDDAWEKNKLELCLKVFENPSVDVVHSDYFIYDGLLSHAYEVKKMPVVKGPFFDALLGSNVVGTPSTIVVRRSACLLFDEKFSLRRAAAEDYDWSLRMAAQGAVFHHLPVPLLRYRVSPSGRISTDLKPWVRGSRMLHRLRLNLAQTPAQKNLARRVYCGDLIHHALRTGRYRESIRLITGYLLRFGMDPLLCRRFLNFIVNRSKARRA